MKSLFLAAILTLSHCAFSQDYLFVASYNPKGDGCINKILKKIPLKKSEEYYAIRKNFYTDYNAVSADMWLLKPGQAAIVYEFKTKIQGFTCEYLAHGIAYGKTVEEATEKMNEAIKNNPRNFLTSPKVEVKWDGKASPDNDIIDCKDLIDYRDKKLLQIFDKQLEKYRLTKDQISRIEDIRKELDKDTWAGTTNLNLLNLTLKTACNSIEDIINAVTLKGFVMEAAKQGTETTIKYAKAYEKIRAGKKALNVAITEDAEKHLIKTAAAEIIHLKTKLTLVENLMKNLNNLNEYSKTLQDVRTQIKAIDKAAKEYNNKLDKSNSAFDGFFKYKNYIDQYLNENCKN